MKVSSRACLIGALVTVGGSTNAAHHDELGGRFTNGAATLDTVRGVVFDSLQQKPLAGATVIAEPGFMSVVTDEQGRFAIGGSDRVRRLVVYHDLFDLTGIGSLSTNVDSSSNTRGPVVISTPSLATI